MVEFAQHGQPGLRVVLLLQFGLSRHEQQQSLLWTVCPGSALWVVGLTFVLSRARAKKLAGGVPAAAGLPAPLGNFFAVQICGGALFGRGLRFSQGCRSSHVIPALACAVAWDLWLRYVGVWLSQCDSRCIRSATLLSSECFTTYEGSFREKKVKSGKKVYLCSQRQ